MDMDISMDIHAKICGYGYEYGWEISYPRQACTALIVSTLALTRGVAKNLLKQGVPGAEPRRGRGGRI